MSPQELHHIDRMVTQLSVPDLAFRIHLRRPTALLELGVERPIAVAAPAVVDDVLVKH